MNKNKLIEILNSNQELFQDLVQSEFLKNNFVGMLRNIESIIPEDSRENFYTNLKTLRIDFNDETMIDKLHGGKYSAKNNKISMDKSILNMAGRKMSDEDFNFDEVILKLIYHELLHMASTTRDEHGEVGVFQNIVKSEEGEFLYADEFVGMTEGFTEYLTLLASNKENFETISIYGRQINTMNHLSKIVGLETMKKDYFNNRNGIQHIEKALQEIDGKQSHIDLYSEIEDDYRYGPGEELYEPTRLAYIGKQLLELSQGKFEIMLENPNLNEKYVKEYWKDVSRVINSKDNLKLMDEDASLYQGIDELENMSKNFLSYVDSKVKSRAEQVEEVDETKTKERQTFVVNAQASLEERHERQKNNVTVVEPTLGTSIEDFAEAIMKNKQEIIVARFNNFEIDSSNYQNPEELIQAYEKHTQRKQQEKISPLEIEAGVAENHEAVRQIMSVTSETKQLVKNDEQEKGVEGVEVE